MSYGSLVPATIASGATASSIVDVGGSAVVGIITPAALTSVAFTFNVSVLDPITLNPLYTSAGAAVSFTVAAGRHVTFSADEVNRFIGVRYIQIIGGTAEGAARTIQVVTRVLQ